jgi:hypothetical protein
MARLAFTLIMLTILITAALLLVATVNRADCECGPDPMAASTPRLVLVTPSAEEWLEWIE